MPDSFLEKLDEITEKVLEELSPTKAEGAGSSSSTGEAAAAAKAQQPGASSSSSADAPQAAQQQEAVSRQNQRIAKYPFKPDAGAVYELPVERGDAIELAPVDYKLPAGWVVAKNSRSAALGLVPEACLMPLPVDPNEPTVEELKEAAESALRKTKADMEATEALLAKRESELEEERRRAAAAEDAKRQSLGELEKVSEKSTKLAERVEELKEQEALNSVFQEVIQKIPKVKELVETRVEEKKKRDTSAEDVGGGGGASSSGDVGGKPAQQAQAKQAPPTPAGEHVVVVVPQAAAEEVSQRSELQEAEHERAQMAKKIQQLDKERLEAVAQLSQAETKYLKASKKVKQQDESQASAERVLRLLPKVKELLAPSQDELTAYLEVMTTAVMKSAEESAVVLLETLAATNDPQQAIDHAFNARAGAIKERRRSEMAASASGLSQLRPSSALRPPPRSNSLPALAAARPPPALPPANEPTRMPPGGVKQPPSRPGSAARPASASRLRPPSASRLRPLSRPPSAASASQRKPLSRPPSGVGKQRTSLPDKLRRTISWDPHKERMMQQQQQSHEDLPRNLQSIEKLARTPPSLLAAYGGTAASAFQGVVRETLHKKQREAADAHILRQNKAREVQKRKIRIERSIGGLDRD